MLRQIERQRDLIGISKTDLCKKVGCNCKSYNNMINKGTGNFATVRKLCLELGITELTIK